MTLISNTFYLPDPLTRDILPDLELAYSDTTAVWNLIIPSSLAIAWLYF